MLTSSLKIQRIGEDDVPRQTEREARQKSPIEDPTLAVGENS